MLTAAASNCYFESLSATTPRECYRIAFIHGAAVGSGGLFGASQSAGKRHFFEGGALAAFPGVHRQVRTFYTESAAKRDNYRD
jgi:hypothetical protein